MAIDVGMAIGNVFFSVFLAGTGNFVQFESFVSIYGTNAGNAIIIIQFRR